MPFIEKTANEFILVAKSQQIDKFCLFEPKKIIFSKIRLKLWIKTGVFKGIFQKWFDLNFDYSWFDFKSNQPILKSDLKSNQITENDLIWFDLINNFKSNHLGPGNLPGKSTNS